MQSKQTQQSFLVYLACCAGVWTVGSFAALLLLNRQLWAEEMPGGSFYLWAGAFTMLLAEAALMALYLSASKHLAKHRKLSLLGKALLALGAAALVFLLFLTLVSWVTCAYQNGFLTRSSLLATAIDFPSIFPFLSFREQATLTVALLAAAAIIRMLVRKAPALEQTHLRWPALFALGAALITAGCLRVVPATHLNPVSLERLEGIVKARLLPTSTILWAPVLYPASTTRTITVPLTRRYELEDYAARVDRNRKHPNLLVFAVESLRQDEVTRMVAGRMVMPAVSRMAEEGFEFRRAYSTGNESLYSMTSLISGLHPLKTPSRDRFTPIDYPMLRLPDLLSTVYDTAFVSSSNEKWQNMVSVSRSPKLGLFYDAEVHQGKSLPADPLDNGFASEIAKGNLRTGTLDDATTTEQLQSWIRRKREKPFFAMVSYQTSHYPYEQGFQIPAPFTPNTFSPEERAGFSFVSYPLSALDRMRNRYWNSLAYIDTQIASTVELLKQSGQLDNTLIVVLGDHGELFYENGRVTHASELHEKTLRVGLVLSGKTIPRGHHDQPFTLLDLPPLLLELTAMPPHAGFQGISPSLPPRAAAKPLFATVQNLAFEDAVIYGDWKYVEQADNAYSALFDLTADRNEQRNARKQFPRHTECLKATLQEFRNNQFAYYQNPEWKAVYFPPRHTHLARTWACEIAFASKRD
ncbi:MAG: sulfatase-like hydrolase/transferase [Bryobacteraceae bacterium]